MTFGDFHERAVLVTGGAGGLGLSIATTFLARGAQVAILDLADAPSEQVVELMVANPRRVAYLQADVADEASFTTAFERATAQLGPLSAVVNNAGVGQPRTAIVETEMREFDRIVRVNLRSVMIGTKLAGNHMIRSGGGCIVNISSVMGLVAQPGVAAYAAAKHGVIGLTKTAALELGPSGVRVNAVCPGRHATPMIIAWQAQNAQDDEAYEAEVRRMHPATRRVGQPHEIAETVAYLCSDAASNIHGVALPVDGGWTAQ